MPALNQPAYRFRVAQLNPHRPLAVSILPDAEGRAALAGALELQNLPEARLTGTLRAVGAQDWLFEGRIEAELVQPCVVTLAPVRSRVDEPVRRLWSADLVESDAEEVEMGDEDAEPLPSVIDMGEVLEEALALALPLYPRAEGAALEGFDAAEQTAEAPEPETRRPFAGLKGLLSGREGGEGEGDGGEGGEGKG